MARIGDGAVPQKMGEVISAFYLGTYEAHSNFYRVGAIDEFYFLTKIEVMDDLAFFGNEGGPRVHLGAESLIIRCEFYKDNSMGSFLEAVMRVGAEIDFSHGIIS